MEKPWLTHYPAGVVHEINPEQYRSVPEMLLKSIWRHTDAVVMVNFGSKLTYSRLDKLSQYFAAYLHEQGWRKGDCLAIMLPNCLQYPVALLAAWRLGLIVTTVNPLYTFHEVAHQCSDAKAKGIIVFNHYADTIEKTQSHYAFEHVFLTGIGDLFGFAKRRASHLVVKLKRLIPPFHLSNAEPFLKALSKGQSLALPEVSISSREIALLQYTGGTTGRSRGVMLTHRNLVANMLQVQACLSPILQGKQITAIVALPLYHIFSLTANLLMMLNIGGKGILITDPRNINSFVKTLRKYRFNILLGVNTLFNALLRHEDFDKIDFSYLRVALGGGMALQESVAERWQKKTGHPLLEGYGLTEASPVVTIMPLTAKKFTGTIGLPVPSTEVCICDDQNNPVPIGEVGELQIKGPQVMKGYWQHEPETREVLDNEGWLRTGDLARLDEEGYLYLVDRKKDLIIVSGFNIYPTEVEDAIAKHPDVSDVAVIGVKQADGTEQVKAVIVKADPLLNEESIRSHCKQWLTAYKIPKIIEFRDKLPRSAVGKILRRELR
ncbi:MAG: AMP-binding protein [Gammaproteobacteria bacterium]|nr:AMP-binding protein [Gammaproteobacteria bacterium]